tara:strand:+ start:30271 stop:31359 length:1089 start_codon:yes stop_codon:yes gene_type:complete
MKKQIVFNKIKRNKFKFLIILLIFILFAFQLFTKLSIFASSNNTSQPLYEIFDKQCNSIGVYEIDEYTEIIDDNKEYLGYCILDAYATSTTLNKELVITLESLYLNISACEIKQNKIFDNNLKSDEEIFIIGHGYGNPSSNSNFLPASLTKYLKENTISDSSSIAFTGDFVRINDENSFKKIKKYIDENFKTYFIALGNHEIYESDDEYFNTFNEDIFIKEYFDTLIIAANFSNSNWLPSEEQINAINTAIEKTSVTNILILSHQIFWLKEAYGEVTPNSYDLLTEELPYDSVGWINGIDDKNLIIISGDYGAFGQETYCLTKENKIFIANGIGDLKNDSILKLSIFKEFIYLEELYLNKNN